ncbi:MAG: CRTAC1 family protein, partial [Acidobacteriaceae bacterium]|nr:CRTAC1 family protein [Acidobacteriaceae bacterium]
PPGEFLPTTNVLYRNRGDGTFEDVSRQSGIAAKKGRALGVAFNDYDRDGFADVFVANDGMEQFLFHNNRNGTFTEVATEAGVSLSEDGKPFAGMGVDFRDYDNDGWPDIIVTNLAKQVYALYHNDGNGLFTYRSREAGLSAATAGNSGWGMRLEDFDNDGWKDLFVAQSHVMDNVEAIDPSLHYRQLPLLALNRQGRFVLGDPPMAEAVAGRGVAFGDLDNNGWQDVVMSVLGGHPYVFHNRGGRLHWLTIRLEGTRSDRDGFGARLRAGGQTQYATSAGSYLSSQDKRVHFGLGTSEKTDLEIWWPSGTHQVLHDVRADQFLSLREPEK